MEMNGQRVQEESSHGFAVHDLRVATYYGFIIRQNDSRVATHHGLIIQKSSGLGYSKEQSDASVPLCLGSKIKPQGCLERVMTP
ncbi:unnamed protein product [Prunus armeniaca]